MLNRVKSLRINFSAAFPLPHCHEQHDFDGHRCIAAEASSDGFGFVTSLHIRSTKRRLENKKIWGQHPLGLLTAMEEGPHREHGKREYISRSHVLPPF